jgi:hypothetical protein
MALLAFWLKLLLKRIIELVAISPVITIGGMLLLSALMYTNTTQVTLDFNKFAMLCLFLTLMPAVFSLQEHPILGKLTFYAKSKYSNRLLRHIFFATKSLVNNIVMALFLALVFLRRIRFDFPFNALKTLLLFPCSVLLSFAVIVVRNNGKKTARKRRDKTPISPVVKSALYDYIKSALMAGIITALSLVIGIELLKDRHMLKEMAEPVFIPLLLFALLAIGFVGLSDSIQNINWMFYSVVSLDFKRQFKRALLVAVSSYAIVLPQYILAVAYVDMNLLLLYLFSIVLMLLLATGIAFLKGNMLKKIAIYGILVRLALYALYERPCLMPAGILPLVIVLVMAKNDFIEWGYA